MLDIFITMLAIPFVLFIPGLVLSFVFFSKKEIDILERIALSIALSLAVVPLIVFYGNLLGIGISKASVLLEISVLLLITGGYLFYKHKKQAIRHETH